MLQHVPVLFLWQKIPILFLQISSFRDEGAPKPHAAVFSLTSLKWNKPSLGMETLSASHHSNQIIISLIKCGLFFSFYFAAACLRLICVGFPQSFVPTETKK